VIRIDRLQKSYPEFDIELDLDVEAGELVSILGPSGSGKTTTLRLIAGFETPDSGRVIVNGRDVTDLRPAERGIGYVFQDYTLFPHMNVAQNIGYGLRIRSVDQSRIDARVRELLDLMDLPGYEARRVDTLSGGERQRVAIARALAVDPILLMLDEPFSSIDEVLRRDLRREIVRLQRELGITVVFVTHSRQEALSISDRVAILRDGRLVQYADPVTLYREPADEFVAGFAGEVSYVTVNGRRLALRPEDVVIEPASDAGAVRRRASRAGRAAAGPDGARATTIIAASIAGRQYLGWAWVYELHSAVGRMSAYDSRRLDPGTDVAARLAGGRLLQ
jgi:ABC-type Fe3+/spermidine/putrescine transport system ATPase subunit